MKKIIIFASMLMCFFCFSGCGADEIVFCEGNHTRCEGYGATFKTKYAENENLTVHMAANIFSEEDANIVIESVKKDCEELEKFHKKEDENIVLYVVDTTISGKPQMTDNEVFCTLSDIESGNYRDCLTGAYFQTDSYWKIIGLSECVFGDTEKINKEVLREFYMQEENYSVLSMSPVFFLEDLAGIDTVQNARLTACGITEYVIAEYGMEQFLQSEDLSVYAGEWLKEIEMDVPKEKIENRLQGMKCDFSDDYLAILEADNYTFYLTKEDWISTAEEYYQFFVDLYDGCEIIFETLEKEEPEASGFLQESMSSPINFYFCNSEKNSSAESQGTDIKLSCTGEVYHEMFHIFIPAIDMNNYVWYYEGLVTYLTNKVGYDYQKDKKEIMFQALTKGETYDALSDEDKIFMEHVADYYSAFLPLPSTTDDLDYFVVFQAIGRVSLVHPELSTTLTVVNRSVAEGKISVEKGGNSLNYAEAMVVIEYLVEEYGLEKVILVAQGKEAFEEAFGGNFETVFKEVMIHIDDIGVK